MKHEETYTVIGDRGTLTVFEIYIKARPDRVWQAITDPEMRSTYTFGVRTDSDWTEGSPYASSAPGGFEIASGENIEVDPPRRLVQSFNALWSDAVKAAGTSRVTWELEPVGEDSTKLTVIHDQLAPDANSELWGGSPDDPFRIEDAARDRREADDARLASLRDLTVVRPGEAAGCARRQRPSAASALRKLGAQHPLLLLERSQHLDEDVLRNEIELAESIHALARALGGLCDAPDQLAHHGVVGYRSDLDAGRARHEGGGLTVREHAHRDGPLSDRVGERSPGVDELVEVEVKGAEVRTDDGPVQLLTDEGQVDQLDQRCLELTADLVSLVPAEWRQMRRGGSRGHGSLLRVGWIRPDHISAQSTSANPVSVARRRGALSAALVQ